MPHYLAQRCTQGFVPPIGAFLGITAATVTLSRIDYSWAGWRPATCMPDACFCEAVRTATVAQPANTWSNLGFVLVGLLICWQGHLDAAAPTAPSSAAPIRRRLALSVLYGGACAVMGLGSLFYHASLTFVGQFFDVAGMYLVAVFVLLYGTARLLPISGAVFVSAYLALNAVLAYLLIAVPELRRWLFAAVLLAGLGVEFAAQRRTDSVLDTRPLRWAVGAMAAAFTIWTLDLNKILCAPHSLAQGHAAWHLLCAAGAGFLYLYYRSERA
jgi:dihydroceramidase